MEITLFLFFQTRISSVFCVIITLETVKSVPEKIISVVHDRLRHRLPALLPPQLKRG